jgi:ATP-dependent DNA ligase
MATIQISSKKIGDLKGISTKTKQQLVKMVKSQYPEETQLVLYVTEDEVEIFEVGAPELEFIEFIEEEPVEEEAYLLPLLYAVDKKGKERVWKTWVVDTTVYKSYGEVGGLKVPSTRTYKGVNVGKVNETSGEEQAKREAERDWVKQLDKGYAPKPGKGDDLAKRILDAKKKQGNVNVNISALIRGVPETSSNPKAKSKTDSSPSQDSFTIPDFESAFLPMHCQPWSNEPKVLKYFDFDNGVYIQPKLDGIRCLVQLIPYQGELRTVLLSRKGKQFVWLKHLREEAKIFLKGYEKIVLDCEVYAEVIHGRLEGGKKKVYSYSEGDPELFIEQRFDVISGAVRPVRKEAHALEGQLSLHVFDIADGDGKLDQDERFEILKKLFSRKDVLAKTPHIKMVETKVIEYPEEIEDYHDEVAAKGYEGVVVRARDLVYESDGRSLRMRKYKMFEEQEFVIVDICCDEGVDREQFTWVCEKVVENEDGTIQIKKFYPKPEGTREQKWEWYDNSDDFIGKLLTVKYQKKTKYGEEDKDVPRFPIGKAIRDYE